MKLTVKSDKDEATIMYVKRDTLRRLKKQAADLNFPSMASYLDTLSLIPPRKMNEFISSNNVL